MQATKDIMSAVGPAASAEHPPAPQVDERLAGQTGDASMPQGQHVNHYMLTCVGCPTLNGISCLSADTVYNSQQVAQSAGGTVSRWYSQQVVHSCAGICRTTTCFTGCSRGSEAPQCPRGPTPKPGTGPEGEE